MGMLTTVLSGLPTHVFICLIPSSSFKGPAPRPQLTLEILQSELDKLRKSTSTQPVDAALMQVQHDIYMTTRHL